MNRNEQTLRDIANDAKDATDGLMKELHIANENLSNLTIRLDRLLMVLALVGGGNLLLGSDLAGKVQRSTVRLENQSTEVRFWDAAYYERLD